MNVGAAIADTEYDGVYKFPLLTEYAGAKKITLTMYRQSGSGTITLYAGGLFSTSDRTSLKSVSVSSSQSTVTVDLSDKVSALTSVTGNFLAISFSCSSSITFYNYSTSGKKAYLEIEMSSGGTVYYCTGGVWKPCEAYFATGGKWVQCEARYGTGGKWKELGE